MPGKQPGKICTWGGGAKLDGKMNSKTSFLVDVSFLLCGELVEEGWGEPRWALGRLMGISCSTGQLERGININGNGSRVNLNVNGHTNMISCSTGQLKRGININGNGSRVEYKCSRSYD